MGRIYDVLRALGIRRTYKGYYYVADAVRLVMTDASRLLYISKYLYPEIARIHGTVVTSCWQSEYAEVLETMAGIRLYRKPTSGEFIDILSSYLLTMPK